MEYKNFISIREKYKKEQNFNRLIYRILKNENSYLSLIKISNVAFKIIHEDKTNKAMEKEIQEYKDNLVKQFIEEEYRYFPHIKEISFYDRYCFNEIWKDGTIRQESIYTQIKEIEGRYKPCENFKKEVLHSLNFLIKIGYIEEKIFRTWYNDKHIKSEITKYKIKGDVEK